MKVKRKPLTGDAINVRDLIVRAKSHWNGLPQWVRDLYGSGGIIIGPDYVITRTPLGEIRCPHDYWLILLKENVIVLTDEQFRKEYEIDYK